MQRKEKRAAAAAAKFHFKSKEMGKWLSVCEATYTQGSSAYPIPEASDP